MASSTHDSALNYRLSMRIEPSWRRSADAGFWVVRMGSPGDLAVSRAGHALARAPYAKATIGPPGALGHARGRAAPCRRRLFRRQRLKSASRAAGTNVVAAALLQKRLHAAAAAAAPLYPRSKGNPFRCLRTVQKAKGPALDTASHDTPPSAGPKGTTGRPDGASAAVSSINRKSLASPRGVFSGSHSPLCLTPFMLIERQG